MVIETEIKRLREEMKQEFHELRKLITGRNITGNWVKQEVACAMLEILPRQLRNVRKHLDPNGKAVGSIAWRKGKGRTVEYYKPDIEKYLSKITTP